MSDRNVEPEAIGNTPIEPLGQPSGPVGSDPLSPDPYLAQKMGLLGRCFGHGETQKGNLVGVALVFSASMVGVLIIASLFVKDPSRQETIDSMFTPLIALLSAVFGYLTGNNSK